MRELARGENHCTKYHGEDQGKYYKVKEEENLKDQCGDGENLPKDAVADVKRKVHCKGSNDYPR